MNIIGNMKEYFSGGHLIESFCFLPSISLNWMHKTNKNSMSWELNFAWLFWYFSIGNVRINLKKCGY